jgi:segregation and condensation protein B
LDKDKIVPCLEALLFASGRQADIKLLSEIMEVSKDEIEEASKVLEEELSKDNRGIQLIRINDGLQLSTKEEFYEMAVKLLDNRPKPSLSQAAMEALAIIAYNPKITRAEIEKIRGVSSDSAINRLLEYNLIEEAGRIDAPGRPMTFRTTDEFLRLFGYSSIGEMPELPSLKEDDGQIELELDEKEPENSESSDYSDEEIEETAKT